MLENAKFVVIHENLRIENNSSENVYNIIEVVEVK